MNGPGAVQELYHKSYPAILCGWEIDTKRLHVYICENRSKHVARPWIQGANYKLSPLSGTLNHGQFKHQPLF